MSQYSIPEIIEEEIQEDLDKSELNNIEYAEGRWTEEEHQ